jgi:hypothetical protein
MGLNPKIKTIELGIEELHTYTIYPLSMADEFKLFDTISDVAEKISGITDDSDDSETTTVVLTIFDVLKENISTVLQMVTKEANRPEMSDIDNEQFTELLELIFDMNFTGSVKNFQSLVGKVKNMFPQTRQSAQ